MASNMLQNYPLSESIQTMSVFLLLLVALKQICAMPTASIGDVDGKENEIYLDIYDINKGLDLHEGDILLKSEHLRNVILGDQYRWDIPVPYVLDPSLDVNAKGVILRAMEQIRLRTCVDFKPRDTEPNYISVVKNEGCYSYVGNQQWGSQTLSIGQWCDQHAIVEHEFLHALGLWHEQSRYDRDDYVSIIWDHIEKEMQHNFVKQLASQTTTLGTLYDYNSVMHYGKDAFTNGNGSTIITLQPEFQDVIGQRLEMSPNDVLKINLLYNCTSAVTFMESCSFENSMCSMTLCARGNASWERVSSAQGGPASDHTHQGALEARADMPGYNSSLYNKTNPVLENKTSTHQNDSVGYFMHYSTALVREGEGAKMQSRTMMPVRSFQCLQFYYFHSGGTQDLLNIWIREYRDGPNEAIQLMGQITGPPSNHWQLHHVPLNATKSFQVELEVLKGAGSSTGGFAIDDINLSETECPHHVWQIPNFDRVLTTSEEGTILLSPRFYSAEGYGIQLLIKLNSDYFGLYFHLVSGLYDDQLQWPCVWRQVTVQVLDQNPQIQQRMSKQISIATDPERTFTTSKGDTLFYWDKPQKFGFQLLDSSTDSFYYAGPTLGYRNVLSYNALWSGSYMKGGDVFFLLSFDDISSLHMNQSDLPNPVSSTTTSATEAVTSSITSGITGTQAVTSSAASLFTDVVLLLLVFLMALPLPC
ncbi:meprin A subunit beta-like isoform X2 [Hypomesus transpacificus]|uniref:meprin A subunit beta-like isoform X2 n=1 Tax=Hypomesus transpacificus TaxID=137520 RepID=UPI001F07C0D6|nr:meprin A subunit beta-like isoform X2 [Hypomesus transpacificus]